MQANKKEQIRETAIRVFAARGFHYSTTDRIAEEAGVSVGTIYNYFRNKEAILEYIFQVELEKRQQFFASLEGDQRPVRQLLTDFLRMHFQAILDHPDVGQILIRERHFPQLETLDFVVQFIQGVPQTIAALLEKAVAGKQIRPCQTAVVAAALFGAVEGVVREAMLRSDHAERDAILRRAPEELVTLFFQGLEP